MADEGKVDAGVTLWFRSDVK